MQARKGGVQSQKRGFGQTKANARGATETRRDGGGLHSQQARAEQSAMPPAPIGRKDPRFCIQSIQRQELKKKILRPIPLPSPQRILAHNP